MKVLKLLLLSLIIFFASCKVLQLPPKYDDHAIALVIKASKNSDLMYDSMIVSTNKTYVFNQPKYETENSYIDSVLSYDSTRKNSGILLTIAGDIKKRFLKYEADHKAKVSLNNSELRSDKDYMHALFETLFNSEVNLKQ